MRQNIVWMLLLGAAAGPLAAQPLQNYVLKAVSADGLSWERLNEVFVHHADVPDAVIGPDGQVYVYFQGLWTPTQDGILVGISPDGLGGWTFHQVTITDTQGWLGRPCDPDVIVSGNTWRLYFTGDPTGDMQPETYSAVSTDGVHFTRETGVRFAVAGGQVLDPSLLWAGGTLQYFAGGAPPGQNWHAHSADGLNFTQQPNFSAAGLMMANGLALPGSGYRFYGFANVAQGGIRSLYSPDGEGWTVESGYRLELDTSHGLESTYVKDSAVVFKDNTYYMYYVTRIPIHPGDLNCDGAVDFDDINPIVLALANFNGYVGAYPECNVFNADCNGDGVVNFNDINAFVALLSRR